MPRLFVALEVKPEAGFQMSLLRGGLSGARWLDRENYHLTLRFLGDMESREADAVASQLDGVRQSSFEMGFRGLGVFGGAKPRSLFALPTIGDDLYALQTSVERRCKRLGLAMDKRKFSPHVTLARLKGATPQAVAHYINMRGGFFIPPSQVTSFVLMSSKASVGGGPYIVEERYHLQSEAAYPPVSSMNGLNTSREFSQS
ncbi:MAG: RNA 2',3'-cyclic phosphodiesterase [Pseudomonadota bacterium]